MLLLVLLTKQTLSLVSGFASESLDLLRNKGAFLCHIEVLHGLNRPRVENLQILKPQLTSGGAKTCT